MILHSIEARKDTYQNETTVDFTKSPHDRIEAVCKRAYDDVDKGEDYHIPHPERVEIINHNMKHRDKNTAREYKNKRIRKIRLLESGKYFTRGNKQTKQAINGDR